LALLGQVPPAKVTGAEILIQDRAIELPLLPERLQDAKNQYSKLRPRMVTAIQDLERDLASLYANLEREGPSAKTYRISASSVSETNQLAAMLYDAPSHTMEAAVVDEWVQWQTHLVRFGLSLPSGGSAITSRMVLLTIKRNELRSSDQSSLPMFDLLAVDGLDYGAWNSNIQGAVELANSQSPRLAKAWQPLAQHLNDASLQMLEFERSAPPTQDPEIRILRLQAKINVLERFRSALWFCQMVWAHMASKPLPPTLRRLW